MQRLGSLFLRQPKMTRNVMKTSTFHAPRPGAFIISVEVRYLMKAFGGTGETSLRPWVDDSDDNPVFILHCTYDEAQVRAGDNPHDTVAFDGDKLQRAVGVMIDDRGELRRCEPMSVRVTQADVEFVRWVVERWLED